MRGRKKVCGRGIGYFSVPPSTQSTPLAFPTNISSLSSPSIFMDLLHLETEDKRDQTPGSSPWKTSERLEWLYLLIGIVRGEAMCEHPHSCGYFLIRAKPHDADNVSPSSKISRIGLTQALTMSMNKQRRIRYLLLTRCGRYFGTSVKFLH
jgi:hypothetical protein